MTALLYQIRMPVLGINFNSRTSSPSMVALPMIQPKVAGPAGRARVKNVAILCFTFKGGF
jgi:hypothetical protein